MSMDAALQTFFAEAEELLELMESALLRIDGEQADKDTLNEIFRAAHTIKGSAGLFGLHAIVGFTHVLESVLDRARAGAIKINTDLQTILLNCRDHIEKLIDDVSQGKSSSDELLREGEYLLQQLYPWCEEPKAASEKSEKTKGDSTDSGRDESGVWHLSLRFGPDVLRNGMDPLSFIRFLGSLGTIKQIITLDDHLPEDVVEFDPETLYLGYEIDLISAASQSEIEEVFDFVRDDSEIRILPPRSKIEEYVELINSLPESNQRLGEILVQSGAVTQSSLDQALDQQAVQMAREHAPQMLGEILTQQNKVPVEVLDAALEKQQKQKETSTKKESRSIRVDAEKIDDLINLIGELVISRQRVDILAAQTGHAPLLEAMASLGGFTEHIRDAALTLRMVQIGDTFQRFRRVVRDTANDLGKKIDLVIRGAETELDRSMVEKLTDPLTHIVRNAVDHGIELPQVRLERGKPETGTLQLASYHDAGNIVIEIADDGGGLDARRIREKAISNGILDGNVSHSDQEIYHLIFHPGLSTADKVTNLSGRGVGMDVVKSNIDALQGSIDIESKPGEGTLLRIRLPLTLAIIDGFHVSSRHTHFIIPQNTVLECMDLAALERDAGRNCVNLRGEQIPYIRLSQIFSLPAAEYLLDEEREKLVVVQFGNHRAAIVVEQLFGEVQTVVKPLSPIFQSLKGIGGSSLMGSGDIAFILDISQIIELAIVNESRKSRSILASESQEQ